MLKLTSLWKRQGKNGDFLAGKLGDANVLVFKNVKKKNPNEPDYHVMLSEPENKGYKKQNPEAEPPMPENEF